VIRQGVSALNDRPLSADSTMTCARLFEAHEKPLLKALPPEPFEIGHWHRPKVPPDYHVVIDGVACPVPFRLIGKTVDVHRTASLVSIFHKAERVACHARRRVEPATVRVAVTLDEHRPASHRAVLRLTPEAVRAARSPPSAAPWRFWSRVPSGKWLELGGGVISGSFNQPGGEVERSAQ